MIQTHECQYCTEFYTDDPAKLEAHEVACEIAWRNWVDAFDEAASNEY